MDAEPLHSQKWRRRFNELRRSTIAFFGKFVKPLTFIYR